MLSRDDINAQLQELDRESDELGETWLEKRAAGHSTKHLDVAIDQVRREVNRLNKQLRRIDKRKPGCV